MSKPALSSKTKPLPLKKSEFSKFNEFSGVKFSELSTENKDKLLCLISERFGMTKPE